MARVCFFCQKPIDLEGKIQFREECPHCRRDLHICKNCREYDPHAYHQCRESQAEYVAEKEKSNLCEYFSFRENGAGQPGTKGSREEAEKLWKKMVKDS